MLINQKVHITRKTSIWAAKRARGKSIGQTDALGLVRFWERFSLAAWVG
jgi:hypothetical protein